MFETPGRAAAPAARCRMCLRWGSLTMLSPRTQGHLRNACGLALLTSGLLTGPSAHLEVLWHLSRMLCRSLRRTSRKRVAGWNRPRGICPHRTNTWRGWWRRSAPTNGPVVVVQSPTPAAGQPPLRASYPPLRAFYPADDRAQLQKTFRPLVLLFELPCSANRGQPLAGRGSHGLQQNGPDKASDGSHYWCPRSLQ